jgi:chromosome segregation and condensation protein ScpB
MTSSNRKVIEAILLLADEPVPARAIGEVLEVARSDVPTRSRTGASSCGR